MPYKTGIEVIQAVRTMITEKNDKTKTVRILEPKYIILTAFTTPVFNSHLKSLKIDYLFEKPMQIEILRNILEFDQGG